MSRLRIEARENSWRSELRLTVTQRSTDRCWFMRTICVSRGLPEKWGPQAKGDAHEREARDRNPLSTYRIMGVCAKWGRTGLVVKLPETWLDGKPNSPSNVGEDPHVRSSRDRPMPRISAGRWHQPRRHFLGGSHVGRSWRAAYFVNSTSQSRRPWHTSNRSISRTSIGAPPR